MAVVVEFRWLGKPVQATIERHKWTCDNPRILRSIESSAALYPGGPEIPYPDRYEAEFVIKDLPFLDGRIIHLGPPPRGEEGVFHGPPPLRKLQTPEDETAS